MRFCNGTVEADFGLPLSHHRNTTQFTSTVCSYAALWCGLVLGVAMTRPLHLDRASLDALRNGPIGAADAARLADALRIKPGERSWATRAALAERDNLIRGYAQRYYPERSRNEQSQCVARDLARYEAGAWRNARSAPECPHRDPRRLMLFQILKARRGLIASSISE